MPARGAGADPAAFADLLAARHPPRRAGGQQDRSRRLRPQPCSTASPRRTRRFAAELGFTSLQIDPDLGALRRQRDEAVGAARRGIDGPTLLDHLETDRRREARRTTAVPLPGAVGQPAEPRFSRLCRHGRRRLGQCPAIGCVVIGSDRSLAGQGNRRPMTARSPRAAAGDAVTLTFEDDIDISRGDLLAADAAPARVCRSVRRTSGVDERGAAGSRPLLSG